MYTCWLWIARGLLFPAVLLLAACGGGGGGGGAGDLAPLNYSGNTAAAVVTTRNAAALASIAFGGDTEGTLPGVTAVSVENPDNHTVTEIGIAPLERRLIGRFRQLVMSAKNGVSAASVVSSVGPVNKNVPCESGDIRLTGSLNDDGTGSVAFQYNNCLDSGETTNGRGTFRVDAYDLGVGLSTDYTLSFSRLTIRGAGKSVDMGGSYRLQSAIAGNTETATMNLVTLNNLTGRMQKTENLVTVDAYDSIFAPTRSSQTVSGRVFDSARGYLDVTTSEPLFFDPLTQSFPDSGRLVIGGNSGNRIRATAISEAMAKLELDLDANGTYEKTAYLKWSDLLGSVGADLGDDDGDGMHNGWESVNRLNPTDPADVGLDNDGDGASNLEEYKAGSDPNDATSTPPGADLLVSVNDFPDPATTGSVLTYTISVSNASSLAATNVLLTDALPANVNLVLVTPGQGTCTGSAQIRCNLGTLNGNSGVSVTISVIPTLAGTMTNAATITSSTFDPRPGNNIATNTTNVGVPPPVEADVSIAVSHVPDPALLGMNIVYSISVLNQGAVPAANVMVTDLLPASVNLVSVTPDVGTCTGTTVITCNLGTLGSFVTRNISIVVIPNAEGVINNSASVTSTTVDPVPANNTSVNLTTIRKSTAGIQALIDAAAPGDTVIVGPGSYLGGLEFRGKDITLQSSAGPGQTRFDGTGGNGVQMGPGGAIRGFAFFGSSNALFPSIEVTGSGSLIAGNEFSGISTGGGIGAAVGGNNASPTIQGNIFRNITCTPNSGTGVVTFINNSGPVIVNNVFENNTCRGINLGLPSGNAAKIFNNTFVGNRAAIRVDRRVPQSSQIYRNNLIVQNGIALEVEFGASDADNPVWENNLVFGNTTDYQGTANQTGINRNISADPKFRNAGSRDYHLQVGSPAIDAGSATGAPAVDFDGTSRPLDGNGDAVPAVDIGAFEAPQIP